MLLLTIKTTSIVEKIINLANKRNDKKLFSWKDTKLPNNILKRAERNLDMRIKGRGLHGFRRAFADRLFNSNFNITDVKEIMRHKSIQTTLEHYKSVNERNLIVKMTDRLDKL
ncbi:MAG: tyrosine-type recombinase/integrase [Ignavibacteria bacterium]|nr:tyrosine-type recombinase/integrase [Ignavibacteria bacterium]